MQIRENLEHPEQPSRAQASRPKGYTRIFLLLLFFPPRNKLRFYYPLRWIHLGVTPTSTDATIVPFRATNRAELKTGLLGVQQQQQQFTLARCWCGIPFGLFLRAVHVLCALARPLDHGEAMLGVQQLGSVTTTTTMLTTIQRSGCRDGTA